MKAWTIKEPGNRSKLTLTDKEIPKPKNEELLIEVHYAGINRLDIETRENTSLTKPYPILGVEVSGIVKENNSNNKALNPGTWVTGLVKNGGYAEYAIIPASRAIVLSKNLTLREGAAIPEVFLTAYQTMYWLGDLKKEETILIHAGASGVGTAAIQMAKKLSNAKIIVTAGSQEKLDFCRQLGADITINYKQEKFDEVILQKTGNYGVDVILDFIGANYWQKNMNSAAVNARWILIGLLGGAKVEHINLNEFLAKCISLKGTLLTPRSDEYKADLVSAFQKNVIPYFASGEIKPIIHDVFSFEDLPKAHKAMEDNENVGRLLVNIK
ncbi:NADPH:quinone oxidoreductase [Tetragenococcus osmophilus]|uniref:NADPH:quinone oxidoreductase n=1 Tax=Tetragenococcus osmophilus TaxID=526944 RepID=A0ABM7A675_9ENTE|nr:NAD(P)H-quinone oxidoreductase [Tetragenococcus osmophilus]AYW46968.1 NADPH:quinone oxidoreductase [Tetragenococcus osmophilus]